MVFLMSNFDPEFQKAPLLGHLRSGPKRQKKSQTQWPFPRSVRLTVELDERVIKYLITNNLAFNQLCQLAIDKFISNPQTIEFLPTTPKK